MKTKIKIISVPPGQAPESVRKGWVGAVIPLISPIDDSSENPAIKQVAEAGFQIGVLGGAPDPKNLGGYEVGGKEAIIALKAVDVDAAKWWENNAPFVLEGTLVFGRHCCELLE